MTIEKTLTLLSQIVGKALDEAEAKSIFMQLNAANAFAPNAMVTHLLEILQLRYDGLANQTDGSENIFSDILARDRYTGYYVHGALRMLYLELAMHRALQPGQENRNFLVLGDFMNLSSVNDAIGRTSTNDVMATICGIYLDSMIRAGVVNWLYYRSMGDEVTFIIIDTPAEDVKNGLANAQRITADFVQSLGLERLKHKKYPEQRGTGLVTAHMALTETTDQRLLKQKLDETIKINKNARLKRSWFKLRRPSVEPDQYHNRSSEQRIDRALNRFKSYRNAAQFSADVDVIAASRNSLKSPKALLLGRAIAWPRDDRIEYLRNHHDNSKIMLRADIYNLGGLNAVFGHDGADYIKSHLIRILYNTILGRDVSEPKIFDCGGGIIDVVINQMPSSQLHRLVEIIQSNIHNQILSLSVEKYGETHLLSFSGEAETLLADLPHPREENRGTGLVMAAHPVETTRSLPEIIERLDKITHRTKMHDFAYLWADDANQVFGLPLNEVPEPVHIGQDRQNPGLHYLPFTDAMRHYLSDEDLPAIFERPVGQICETLFGTDMQAVLGFKKAIRILQDKQINDDSIEDISSYEAMDARLAEEDLPPLSVVSTQNRPSFVNNEREAFKTMALAQKLEQLPSSLTDLILQAQASFRTLKIMQPHGHLPPDQALNVLLEEIAATSLLKEETEIPAEHPTESMYRLARLLDGAAAALDKELPLRVRQAMSQFAYHILYDVAASMTNLGELFLGQKFFAHTKNYQDTRPDLHGLLLTLNQEISSLMEKINKKGVLDRHVTKKLNDRLNILLQAMFSQSLQQNARHG